MRVAQGLYEDGLITYMRTDGVDMAPEAISAARRAIANRYDAGFVPDKPRQYQSKIKNAQEAHEAIRPDRLRPAARGSGDHARLYELVYNRALASQMASARLERTTVELTDGAGRAMLRATGQVVLFPGFIALYDEGRDEKAEDEEGARMPALREGDAPAKTGVEAIQHFTQPPPRYSEASLVKRLEELGHRPAVDLCRDPADAEGPRICPRRQGPLRARGERAAGDCLPRALLRELRQLRLYRRARGRAGRRLRRPARLAEIARRLLARLQAQGRRGHGPEAERDHRRARRVPRALALPAARGRQRPAPLPAMRQRPAVACAAASSAPSSPAPTIPTANIRRSSARAATRRRATGRPSSATASCSRAGASGPISSAATSAHRSPRTFRWTT